MHLLRLKPVLPHTLRRMINEERQKSESVVIRSERGKIIFDHRQKSFILNRYAESISVEKQRYLAERVAEVPYSFTPGIKGIWFNDRYYFTSEAVNLFASNEYAFAVAGEDCVEIFDNGLNYRICVKAKKICWGSEGLYVINDRNELELIKEFKYGNKNYEIRSIANYHKKFIHERAELVNCDKFMCIVYRSDSRTLNIDIVNGKSMSFAIPAELDNRVVHFGSFYWQQTLNVFFILANEQGVLSAYHEISYDII